LSGRRDEPKLDAVSYKVLAGNGAREFMVEYLKNLGQRKMAQWALAYAAAAWVRP
jgi:hypothetical protein